MLFWSSDQAVPSLSQPVLAGFTFSRLGSPGQVSEEAYYDSRQDVYQHPDAMGEPSESFSAAKDVYALGTVLLEVGEWRSLKSPGRESHRCEQTRRTDNLTRKSQAVPSRRELQRVGQ